MSIAIDRLPRQLNSEDFPQSESDDRTRNFSLIAFAPPLPDDDDRASGGDMRVHWKESCEANDDSTMLNAVTTEQGNLALSWILAIQCILIS